MEDFSMLNQDILKEFIFDCQMRKLSERTIKGYKNNNLKMLHFISTNEILNTTKKIHDEEVVQYETAEDEDLNDNDYEWVDDVSGEGADFFEKFTEDYR
jgi:hypothetical protein